MQVVAKVTINNSSFDEWAEFFDSYKRKRDQFVRNEVVEKINDKEAKVSFEIVDLEGLTQLSSSDDITSKEAQLGVLTEIL
jgi:hypothetical protein